MDLAAEYFHRHTPLPRVLCQLVAAFYEPLLSELVERYLARHRTCTIELHKSYECFRAHYYSQSVTLTLKNNGKCQGSTRNKGTRTRPAPSFTYVFVLTDWDSIDHFPRFGCSCKTPRFKFDLREVCESDCRAQWTQLLLHRVGKKRKH